MASIDHRSARKDAKPSLATLAALVAFALALPFGSAQADDHGSSPGVADITAAIGRGIVTVQEGVVSWYGAQFHNRKTASGERFDVAALTMAHPSLPFGTVARVTNRRNGRSVVVRVNDRGPFVGKRIADLSEAAATEIGMLRKGLAKVRIEVLGDEEAEPEPSPQPVAVASAEPTPSGPAPFSSAP
ncbi:MAG: septal ring lytic transglycosylase RlpA family protein [Steroidobacteraceae bacterium]